jgi:hypothetical protein
MERLIGPRGPLLSAYQTKPALPGPTGDQCKCLVVLAGTVFGPYIWIPIVFGRLSVMENTQDGYVFIRAQLHRFFVVRFGDWYET